MDETGTARVEAELRRCAAELEHAEFEERFIAAYRAGAERWPSLGVDAEAWTSHIVEHLLAADDADAHLQRLAATDFYLATACALQDERAVEAFDGAYRGLIEKALRRNGATADSVDESRQRLNAKLFLAEGGGRPKIAQYTGYGALGQWVRVVAVRQGYEDRRRADRRRSRAHAEVPEVASDADPELRYLQGMYRAQCAEAFVEATQLLTERDRELLGLYVHARANIDDLGARYGVHRATAARWLAAARAKILHGAHRALAGRIGVDRSTASSIFRFVRSELTLSFPAPVPPS